MSRPAAPSLRKVRSLRSLVAVVRRLKRHGQRVVFANGCFDVVHVGHVALLERAKGLGDVLVVGLNSDRSVQALKGAGRPIVSQRDRARVIAALSSVDYVTVFDGPTPLGLIERLKPDVLVKGADWPLHGIIGREILKRSGGRVVRVSLVNGYSTTKLLDRIRRLR